MTAGPTVVGLFGPGSDRSAVLRALLLAGVAESDVSVIGPGRRGAADGARATARPLVGDGLLWGAGVGAAVGLVAAAAAFALPELDGVLALGPIAPIVTLGTGGGLAGALVDWGRPERPGHRPEDGARQGDLLVIVANSADAEHVEAVLRRAGARDVYRG